MKQPEISNLKGVTQEMIDMLEKWLIKRPYTCPLSDNSFDLKPCNEQGCYNLFNNLSPNCPDSTYGRKATILALTIICDVWAVYYGKL